MDTRRVEALLAKKYGYKPLDKELSLKYRGYFEENIPGGLCLNGDNIPLYTMSGTKICNRYRRIVVGDYGAFVEFNDCDMKGCPCFIVKPGQEYRIQDPKYSKNVKYWWLTAIDDSGIKIYEQRRTVDYADYIPGMYYVSVHEVRLWKGEGVELGL